MEKELIKYLDEKFEEAATKKDLKELHQNVDEKFGKAFDVLVTKEEVAGLRQDMEGGFQELRQDIDGRFTRAFEVFATKEEIRTMDKRIDLLAENVNALTNAVEKLVKEMHDLRIEFSSLVSQVGRHERWIHQIAEKLNFKLE